MQFPRPPRRQVRIDISALIDVVFLLLIFFAVTTSFLENSGLELELPSADTAATPKQQEVTVWVTADGELHFQGQKLTLGDLAPRLRSALETADRKFVVIMADRSARLEQVVAVMDLARKAGAKGLTIGSQETRRSGS